MPKNKKISKLKQTLRWLKPTTASHRLLLFVISFAVIGGGYAVYKSFAYTYSDHSWTYYSNKPGEITLRAGSAVKQTDSHGGLPNTTIWRLEDGAKVGANISVYSANITRTIRACVRFRFTNGTSNNYFTFQDTLLLSGPNAGSYTYRTVCGNPRVVQFPGTFNEAIRNNGPGDLYIQWIGIVW